MSSQGLGGDWTLRLATREGQITELHVLRYAGVTALFNQALQGSPRGWTEAAANGRKNGPRWKLVGNAETVGVGRWIADRLESPAAPAIETEEVPDIRRRWPDAAWGDATGSWVLEATQWPRLEPIRSLLDIVNPDECNSLSQRAADGFLTRAERGSLRFADGFLDEVRAHAMQLTST